MGRCESDEVRLEPQAGSCIRRRRRKRITGCTLRNVVSEGVVSEGGLEPPCP
jgi:hypothetical protein